MLSTPAAITTSYAPAITPCAAKCAACCDEPHWRSTVVPGTDSGNPAARAAARPTLPDWSPICITQPTITSSTTAGSSPFRSTSACNTCAARSTGCQLPSWPFRRPSGVRTASTMTAVAMAPPLPSPSVRGHGLATAGRPARQPIASAAVRNLDRSLGDGGMPLLEQLGLSFERYGEGWAEATWTPTALACNPRGVVHGGVYGVVHDAAMNFATNSALESGDRVATLDVAYQTRRAPNVGDPLAVRGAVVQLTRQVAYVESTGTDADGGGGSEAVGTFIR